MEHVVLRLFAKRRGLKIEQVDGMYRVFGIGIRGMFILGADPREALARLMLATAEWTLDSFSELQKLRLP